MDGPFIAAIIFIICLVALLLFLSNSKGAKTGPNTKFNPELSKPTDYGSGVYYFPYTENEFGMALAHFLKTNPRKRITSVSGDGTSGYGATAGYFVTTEDK